MTRTDHGVAAILFSQVTYANADAKDIISSVVLILSTLYGLWHFFRFWFNV